MPPHTLFCTARAENTFGTMTMCNLGDSRMHYRRSCPQRFVNPMFPRLATLIIHRKIGQCLFSNGICFSPQPPEGGCMSVPLMMQMLFGQSMSFQLTAARRRLPDSVGSAAGCSGVSTHSRPKTAARPVIAVAVHFAVSTHSRPKTAAFADRIGFVEYVVSTHSLHRC